MTVTRIGEGEERAKETDLTPPEEFEAARRHIIFLLEGQLEEDTYFFANEYQSVSVKIGFALEDRNISVKEMIEELRANTEVARRMIEAHINANKSSLC